MLGARRSRQKQFINSYHLNEVPLPYYNPLQDPSLKGFFFNRRVKEHINRQGYLYRPLEEYPYE